MAVSRRKIGFFLFNGITALDLAGPMDAFGAAVDSNGAPLYELLTFAQTKREVAAENGLVLKPLETLAKLRGLDTIVIPGGRGLREPRTSAAMANWLSANSKKSSAHRLDLHRDLWDRAFRLTRRANRDYTLEIRSRCANEVPKVEGGRFFHLSSGWEILHVSRYNFRYRSLAVTH